MVKLRILVEVGVRSKISLGALWAGIPQQAGNGRLIMRASCSGYFRVSFGHFHLATQPWPDLDPANSLWFRN